MGESASEGTGNSESTPSPPAQPLPGWGAPASWSTLLLTTVFLGFLSVTKELAIVFALPVLIVSVPLMIATRYMVRVTLARGASGSYLPMLARLQFISLITFFVFLPGMGDRKEVAIFGVMRVDPESTLATVSSALWCGGLLAFFALTGIVLVLFLRAQSFPRMRALFKWSIEYR